MGALIRDWLYGSPWMTQFEEIDFSQLEKFGCNLTLEMEDTRCLNSV